MCEQYNGWSNRETWCTMLHIDNTLGEGWLLATLESFDSEDNFRTWKLGDYLKEQFEEILFMSKEYDRKLYELLLEDIGSLYRVDWREIAESIVSQSYYANVLNLQSEGV